MRIDTIESPPITPQQFDVLHGANLWHSYNGLHTMEIRWIGRENQVNT